MNGVRSISRRKGYLLTALAAAVLLAASSGTAYAQQRATIGFSGSSGTLYENAFEDLDPKTADPLLITINVSGVTRENLASNPLGTVNLVHNADTTNPGANDQLMGLTPGRVWQIMSNGDKRYIAQAVAGSSLTVEAASNITLAIIDKAGDANWKNDTITLEVRLTSAPLGVSPSPATFTVRHMDDDATPFVRFTKSSFKMTEETSATGIVAIDVGVAKGEKLPGAFADSNTYMVGTGLTAASPITLENTVTFTISPHEMVAHTDDDTTTGDGMDESMCGLGAAVSMTGATAVAGRTGMFTTATSMQDLAAAATADALSFTACEDMKNFRDAVITFSIVPSPVVTTSGSLTVSNSFTLTIESDEATPTVKFSTANIIIDEGGRDSVYLVADSMQGDEVGMVYVEVGGDAMISLEQDSDPIEANANGSYTVMFGESANTELTINSESDPALEDGMMATATITITNGNGAEIGDPDTVTVTVNGSTAVPALPLFGQLLLALFLMVGGARLYRRRQG